MRTAVTIAAFLMVSVYAANLCAQDLRYKLTWIMNDQYAGELMAYERGWYRKADINLTMQPFDKNGVDPLDAVLAGISDIGIYETITLVRRILKEKVDIVIFGLREQLDPAGYMSLAGKNIKEPDDLAHHVYGYYNNADITLLRWFAELNNVDQSSISLKKVDPNDMASILSGDVDFITAHETNEPVVLKLMGYDTNFLPISGPKGAVLGDAFFCRKEFYEKNKDMLKRFLQVTSRGWREAVAHPDEATSIVMRCLPKEHYVRGSRALTEKKMVSGIKIREFYLTYRVGSGCIGCMSRSYWDIVLSKLVASHVFVDSINIDDIIRFEAADALLSN